MVAAFARPYLSTRNARKAAVFTPSTGKTMTSKFGATAKWQSWTPYLLSALRIITAFCFMQHGMMKLFAFPKGMGPENSTAVMWTQIWFAGVFEAFGDGLMLLGLFTRPVAFLLSGEMAVTYFQFHASRGFWPAMNGGEVAVLFCFIWLFISAAGGGPLSVDAMLKKK